MAALQKKKVVLGVCIRDTSIEDMPRPGQSAVANDEALCHVVIHNNGTRPRLSLAQLCPSRSTIVCIRPVLMFVYL